MLPAKLSGWLALNGLPTIRVAQAGDAAEIARLCEELGYPARPEDLAARLPFLLGDEKQWVAVAIWREPKVMGWIAAERRFLLESGERVEIVGLVVDPAARREGIGKALVSEAERWAASRGISTVFVRSNIARRESHYFYDRIGYKRTKTQHAYTKVL